MKYNKKNNMYHKIKKPFNNININIIKIISNK